MAEKVFWGVWRKWQCCKVSGGWKQAAIFMHHLLSKQIFFYFFREDFKKMFKLFGLLVPFVIKIKGEKIISSVTKFHLFRSTF